MLAQDGDPGARQPGLGRAGEVHVGQHREGLGVDVGLQEPVEQHQAVRARLVKPQGHLADRAEVRAQLDRHRHGHRVLDPAQDVDVPLLDLAAGDVRVARYVVDVQLDRRGARVLHRARVAGPAARRHAVDAADDRYVDRRRGALEQAQVAARARFIRAAILRRLRLGLGREVGQGLGESLRAHLGQPRVLFGLPAQLLLEQGVEHHRADTAVGQPPDAVDGIRERGRGGDERIAQRQSQVAGRKVHQSSFRASAGNCWAPRVAISS